MEGPVVKLEFVKQHLAIEEADTFKDKLLEAWIDAASEAAEHILQRPLVSETDEKAVCTTADDLPKSIQTWICLYVNDLDRNRGLLESGDSKIRHYDHLLDRFIKYDE